MLWVNHAPALKALGTNETEYYREIWLELSHFIRCLRRESEARDRKSRAILSGRLIPNSG
jgi:hypothetical protein